MSKNLQTALQLIETELEESKRRPIRCNRLETIRDKLKRIMSEQYDHEDDLSSSEKKEKSLNNLKKYILETYESDDQTRCANFRVIADIEGLDYFFYDYICLDGVDYETYHDFVQGNDCLCGECNDATFRGHL
jgi:hypothetical protein